MTRQRLGQNFLTDSGWQRKILAALPRKPGETWVEIGAGHGEMTPFLAGDGRRVVAIETDAVLARHLQSSAGLKDWPGIEVVHADVLETNLAELGGEKFRVYGNLPYYITSPILHQLFLAAGHIESIHIVVQLEVAARIAAKPSRHDYGYLSVACQFYANPEIVMKIPPGAFRPIPRVTSALVQMTLPGQRAWLDISDEKRFLGFVHICFSQKRKTLRNNLRAIASDERIYEALAERGLPAHTRAEQLTVAQLASLFKNLR
ncbi:MAG TPA: 16S rRNA (adenine(1518)-N(6)/adenine(1519)-N(6))-dimethyltransferase RsmA [Candidatus Acidoferrum sp.]|nr:16S rRNA (adenine(1518)-N(6)/adenine(1519)-N(6))-dimethyltransferase RsmA [Candidatus Acidoferrum sp.]